MVEKYTQDMDIKIYNATQGGMLEVFESVDLDNALNDINEVTVWQ